MLQNLGGSRHSSVLWVPASSFQRLYPCTLFTYLCYLCHTPCLSQEPSLPCFISQIRASNSFQTKDTVEQIICWEQQYPQAGLGFPCFIYCCTSQIYWLGTPENSRHHLFCQGTVAYSEVSASKLSPSNQSLFGTGMPKVQQFQPIALVLCLKCFSFLKFFSQKKF